MLCDTLCSKRCAAGTVACLSSENAFYMASELRSIGLWEPPSERGTWFSHSLALFRDVVSCQAQWPDGHRLASQMNYKWPTLVPTRLTAHGAGTCRRTFVKSEFLPPPPPYGEQLRLYRTTLCGHRLLDQEKRREATKHQTILCHQWHPERGWPFLGLSGPSVSSIGSIGPAARITGV